MKMPKENIEIRERILKGMEISHKRLVKEKKEKNLDLIISENGKIVRIPARDL